jgi:thiamine biosynthesis lipoprotein
MMLTRRFVLFLSLLAVVAAGRAEQRFDFSGPGMATTFRIACYAEDRATAEKAVAACFERIARLHAVCTDYDPTSELMRLCAPEAARPMAVSADLFGVLERAQELAVASEGAFNPACGHLAQLWRRTRRTGKLPPVGRVQYGLEAAGRWRQIRLDPATREVTLPAGTLLDLGGIAKGYAADACLRILREHGLERAVVQAGGDTAVGKSPPGKQGWEVKLRTFTRPGEDDELRVLTLADCAVSTSGDLYQFLEIDGVRYSHIVSLVTGLGLTERIACSVIASDCTTSDALATALCVLGPERGQALAEKLGVKAIFALPLQP